MLLLQDLSGDLLAGDHLVELRSICRVRKAEGLELFAGIFWSPCYVQLWSRSSNLHQWRESNCHLGAVLDCRSYPPNAVLAIGSIDAIICDRCGHRVDFEPFLRITRDCILYGLCVADGSLWTTPSLTYFPSFSLEPLHKLLPGDFLDDWTHQWETSTSNAKGRLNEYPVQRRGLYIYWSWSAATQCLVAWAIHVLSSLPDRLAENEARH